ncbi:hypothetical protein B0T16DRAFT_383366 [Cercophora newfieldiana]|uniref:Uncharacterized protein n=1 Tax=Cercophora newfieldiana TaxID=92897 RepID=A0AA40CJB3_9PEZI|nr:hypothetical protein B0T16DRAFT_383366 [Cercophora newfieldiana]
MSTTTVLITGGNRGIGLGLVAKYLSQPNYTVIAANRDPNHPTSQALFELPKGAGSNLIVVKYDASQWDSAKDAVQQAQAQGVSHLDIVIANAAIAKSYPLVKDAVRSEMLEHYEVNVFGPIALYQATRDLLQKSPGKPVLALMGSGSGGLGRQPPVPSANYGATKAALHWYGIRINAENDWLNTLIVDPGWVKTEMGNEGARILMGLAEAPGSVEETINGTYNLLATTTKEKHGGKVVLYTGEVQIF